MADRYSPAALDRPVVLIGTPSAPLGTDGMSRKSFLLVVGILLLCGGGVAAVLALMIAHEPDFYRRAAIPPGEQRQKWSRECLGAGVTLISHIKEAKTWGARFTQEQINSYLEEEFLGQTPADRALFPEGIRDLRVAIEEDRIRVGFRYGGKRWSTIVSLDLRVWLAKGDPNVVALEVQGMRLGSLPITTQSVLERFSDAIQRRQENGYGSNPIEMTWYRHNGKPVALLRFSSSRKDPSVQLLHLKMQPGAISISGADRAKSSAIETPPPAATPPAGKS